MDANSEIMQIWLPLVVAALVQASLGLGVSVLTLLSGTALARRKPKPNSTTLTVGFVFGSVLMTKLLLIGAICFALLFFWIGAELIWWSLAAAAVVLGLAILLFYYRKDDKGTRLWLPRSVAEYIYARTKKTKTISGSALLGVESVGLELPLSIVPLLITGYILAGASTVNQYVGIGIYVLIASLPIIALAISYAVGRKVGAIQRWRERNKKFMQFSTGILLVVLGIYLLTYKILGV